MFVLTCTVVILTCFFNLWVCVCVGIVMCGCVCMWGGGLVICVILFTVFFIVFPVFLVLIRLFIFILICFPCTSVRTTAD